ncbi:MAG: YceI family protein [Bacteroidia bacterium]|nr:YceI family protein [Bacteroidia bacterium]MDW8088633.1 YceI family protein [Bacteroidia bacterium]
MRWIWALPVALLFLGCQQGPQPPAASIEAAQPTSAGEGKSIQLTPATSQIIAIGRKLTGKHEIRFPLKSGQLTLAPDNCIAGGKIVLDISKLEVLDLKGEWKGKLEEHLRSEDFFLTTTYPEAIFEITGCEKSASDTVYLAGNLTLRGVTKNIRFPAVVRLTQDTLYATANFTINRQEWGIAYKGKADDLIQDEVAIQLNLRAP